MLGWFFFVKQKTAYEMRISDWSSDVCSSDLSRPHLKLRSAYLASAKWPPPLSAGRIVVGMRAPETLPPAVMLGARAASAAPASACAERARASATPSPGLSCRASAISASSCGRSEAHTSELQSLMRTSYAVL